MTTTADIPVQIRQDTLRDTVLLLRPAIGRWTGLYKLPRDVETLNTGHENIDVQKGDVTTPQARLLTAAYPLDSNGVPWHRHFQRVEQRLTRIKEQYSVPYPIPGVRIVPKARGMHMLHELFGTTVGWLRQQLRDAEARYDEPRKAQLEERLASAEPAFGQELDDATPVRDPDAETQSIAYELHQLANTFCRDWPTIRNEIAQASPVFSLVASKVPVSGALMRQKFYLDIVPVEVADVGDQAVTADTLREHASAVRETCRRQVEAAIAAMVQGPREQLAAALTGLQAVVARHGRVTAKSFSPVRDAIAKIRLFECVADDEILRTIARLEQQLDDTAPRDLNQEEQIRQSFSTAIDQLQQEVEDAERMAAAMNAFGQRQQRRIDLG